MLQKIKQIGIHHRKVLTASLVAAASSFQGNKVFSTMEKKYEEMYDLAVIGGGSGGLSTAFQASGHGVKTIVIDYVQESPSYLKTKWGLGGTCVNVGCIPKKLMHQASKMGQSIVNANDYGWQLPDNLNNREKEEEVKKFFNWRSLRMNVLSHIKSLNFGYLSNINREDKLEYLNAMATFISRQALLCSKDPSVIRNYIKTQELPSEGDFHIIKAKNFLVATGTRPQYLECQGADKALTSDDIFYKKNPPGKTLVVGGGYVAIQIAGFLRGLGYDVSMMTRSIYLRSFDRDMVEEVINNLKMHKVNIIPTSLPKSITEVEKEKFQVEIQNQETKEASKDTFDTVLFAIGRYATTDLLNLDKIGVERAKNKKIVTLSNQIQKTSVDNIYAIGDVVDGLPELTSTAIKMGQNLGRRIANLVNGTKFPKHKMVTDLQNFPTTVFSPLQYACCGMSEQKAIQVHGENDIEVYRIKYYPLEVELLEKYDAEGNPEKQTAYAKAIVRKSDDRVVGLHYAGPNAGQIMQGFAVAMKLGLTKTILDDTIGIHPTSAERITQINVTKSSGLPFEKLSC